MAIDRRELLSMAAAFGLGTLATTIHFWPQDPTFRGDYLFFDHTELHEGPLDDYLLARNVPRIALPCLLRGEINASTLDTLFQEHQKIVDAYNTFIKDHPKPAELSLTPELQEQYSWLYRAVADLFSAKRPSGPYLQHAKFALQKNISVLGLDTNTDRLAACAYQTGEESTRIRELITRHPKNLDAVPALEQLVRAIEPELTNTSAPPLLAPRVKSWMNYLSDKTPVLLILDREYTPYAMNITKAQGKTYERFEPQRR